MTNPQQYSLQNPKIRTVWAIPLERLYVVHRDIKSYHEKWDKNQVVEIVDLATIDNFYTGVQQFIRLGSVVGAGLYLGGYSTQGGVTAAVGLCIDLMASSYKEKFYQPEERKRKRNKLNDETENLANSYQEIIEILKPIHTDGSLGNLGQVINTLKKEAVQFIENDDKNNSKELELLKSSPKDWNPKGLWSRLRISQRNGNPEWEKWKNDWEARRNEQNKVMELIAILQESVSKYRQGMDEDEIEKEIDKKLLELNLIDEIKVEDIVEETKEVVEIGNYLLFGLQQKDNYEQEQIEANENTQLTSRIEIPVNKL